MRQFVCGSPAKLEELTDLADGEQGVTRLPGGGGLLLDRGVGRGDSAYLGGLACMGHRLFQPRVSR
jgi:hypothetical protein